MRETEEIATTIDGEVFRGARVVERVGRGFMQYVEFDGECEHDGKLYPTAVDLRMVPVARIAFRQLVDRVLARRA